MQEAIALSEQTLAQERRRAQEQQASQAAAAEQQTSQAAAAAPQQPHTQPAETQPQRTVMIQVEIKILRHLRAAPSRRPPRHRRDACSMSWRCRFLAARRSQHGRVIAET